VHARACVLANAVLEDATIVISDGRIVTVASGAAPAGRRSSMPQDAS
jgi:hypothetical protein